VIRRFFTSALIGAGLLVIAIGVQRWFDAHAAETVVHQLMNAINAGDRQAVLALLHSDRRRLVEMRTDYERNDPWTRQVGVTYRIQQLDITGDNAVVRLSIAKGGFEIHPAVYLRRGQTTRWKIERLDNLQVDPRWLSLQRRRVRQESERLTEQIQNALQNRPGVTVDRVTIGDLPNSPL
jgi:hypothetical protein